MLALRAALVRLRARPGRALLAAVGIAAAGAMLGTAVTLSYGLGTGFDRAAARADLPDVLVRFDDERIEEVESRVRRLPNVEASAYRQSFTGIGVSGGSGSAPRATYEIVREGRRGYAIVAGRDLRRADDEVVIERGLSREWGVDPGEEVVLRSPRGFALPLKVVGVAVAPDNVAYPLANKPRLYVSYEGLKQRRFEDIELVNTALLWVNDPERTDVTLTQARVAGFGISNLRFVTRDGIRLLLDQAAGIVIALLVAFSLVALGSAALMLAASAQAEVQRRLETIGVLRALGFTRTGVVARASLDAALVAVPAGALGIALGALVALGPSARLLETLNELPPGRALLGPLALAYLGLVGVVCIATAWPVWRATAGPVAGLLRGAELPSRRAGPRLLGGAVGLGARMAAARRGRLAGTVVVLGTSTAVALLLLALAGLFERLQNDPGTVGKRYAITARLPPEDAGAVRALPGVRDAAPRYVVEAADSFRLGTRLRLVAYPGDHTAFENPALAEGRRARGAAEAELGVGLASALGIPVGGTLAAQLPSGAEVRLRVVGLVHALENEGQIAYTRAGPLLDASPGLDSTMAVVLRPNADRAAVERGLRGLGAVPEAASGATTRSLGFLGVLASLLRVVAVLNGLVCLYALVQALALTAVERRPSIAVLRAAGAGRGDVALVFLGAAGLVVALAAPAGVLLERVALGPIVSRLAIDYAALSLAATPAQTAVTVLALVLVAGAAAVWVGRRIEREPIVAGLREE